MEFIKLTDLFQNHDDTAAIKFMSTLWVGHGSAAEFAMVGSKM